MDVLLRHRGELGLTDPQVARLEALDEQREADVASLRAQLKALRETRAKAGKDVASGAVSAGGPGTMGGGRGGLGGSFGHGGAAPMGRAPGGGGRTGAGRLPRGDDEVERLRQKMDDADTRAFVDAQTEVLTEAQRPEAERLASAYRAALFDFREALRQRHGEAEE